MGAGAIAFALPEYSIDPAVVQRIGKSVLRVENFEVGLGWSTFATALVWDFIDDHVLILTNYHTLSQEDELKSFLLPKNKKSGKRPKLGEMDPIRLRLSNDSPCEYEFICDSSIFFCCDEEYDFAVLRLPRDSFNKLSRIPIRFGVDHALRVHAIGYIGHAQCFTVQNGEVSTVYEFGFDTTIPSAPGFSGSAVIVDIDGRAVGYMYGNIDFAKARAFRFDMIIKATHRQPTPSSSPIKLNDVSSASSSSSIEIVSTKPQRGKKKGR